MAVDGRPAGIVALADEIKPSAPDVVQELKRRGLDVVHLTGDNESTARFVGAAIGIDPERVRAGVLPDRKAAIIAEFKARGGTAMVGDGLNDAPAPASADVASRSEPEPTWRKRRPTS